MGFDRRFHSAAYRELMCSGRWSPATLPAWREAEGVRPGLIAHLEALAYVEQCPEIVVQVPAEDPLYGTTTKLLLRLADGREVESVAIPMSSGGHRTACVSSQVGCKQGCAFCRTARMGLVRDLAAHEIVGQVVAVNRALGQSVRNVVFMGMGEPLDNPLAVAQAAAVFSEHPGLSLAWSRITISTVGRLDGLAAWADLGLGSANLAISLHAADTRVRATLVPAARIEPLDELRHALGRIELPRGRRIMLAVVVIPGVTDQPVLIEALHAWIGDLPVLVNLIPFNPFPGVAWRAPEPAEMQAMWSALRQRGLAVRTRITKGRSTLAACGQLATARRPDGADPRRGSVAGSRS